MHKIPAKSSMQIMWLTWVTEFKTKPLTAFIGGKWQSISIIIFPQQGFYILTFSCRSRICFPGGMFEQFRKPDKFSQKREISPFIPSPLLVISSSIIWSSVKWVSNKTHWTWWYVLPLATRCDKTWEDNIALRYNAVSADITPGGVDGIFLHKLLRRAHPCSHCTLSHLNKLLEERDVCCGHFSGSLIVSFDSVLIWFNTCSIPSDKYFTASCVLFPGPLFCWQRANPR